MTTFESMFQRTFQRSLGRCLGAAVATSLLVACGRPGSRTEAMAVQTGEVAPVRAPLALPLTAVTVRGELLVQRGTQSAWEPLGAGASLTGVRTVKAVRRGAIVALGDAAAAPLVYLRADAVIELGQDAEGAVHVSVGAGRVRLRRGPGVRTIVDTRGGGVTVMADVLVDAAPRERGDVVPTGVRPDAAAFSFALAEPDAEVGVGRMEARGAADRLDPLALRALHVDVRTTGDLAVTEVTHVFHNGADERREGTFRFPLPDGAMLVGLALEIDGTLVEGEIVERDKARQVYENIVDEMLDPALLEWEQGNWFKLRVFPLEARADKRVVIRYVTPLVRAAAGWEYAYAVTAPPQTTIGELTVTVDGQRVLGQQDLAQGVDLVVPVAAARVPAVMRETRGDAIYTAVRIAPALAAAAPTPVAPGGRRLAIVFDTSRSMLEGRAQALGVLATTLRQLTPADRFVVLASDVEIAPSADTYEPATADAIARALALVGAIEPDGASDLGAALLAVDARDPSDVIYIGDGIPTWGEQQPAALAALAEGIGAPIDAALIGKGATTALWGELSGRTGGRAVIVRSHTDEQRFALAATTAGLPRLTSARVVIMGAGSAGAAGTPTTSVFPAHATTLFAGDELVAVLRTPVGQPVPAAVRLTGVVAGAPYTQDVALTPAVDTTRVAQRWARQQLAVMEATEAPKEQIVALSTELGVMSTFTSLLVLENDEAYRQFQIARTQAQAQLAQATPQVPQVTGGDLDTLGARRASLSPDEIQPGDPEIKIPAPRDARTVVVSFPFGETKLAVWDADQAAWMVRFLIDQATADGVYQVRVTITHADGRLEVLTLPYTVDTRAPLVALTAARQGRGYLLVARQRSDGEKRKDADRVEVVLPDGTIQRLTLTAWGRFEGTWIPAAPLTAPVTLRVVARDNALNQAVSEMVIAPGVIP